MDIQRINGSAGAWKVESPNPRKTVSVAKSGSRDRVELSSDGGHTRSAGHGVAKLASASPEIRLEKVEEAREKVDSGYYDKPETIEKVANRMVDDGFTK